MSSSTSNNNSGPSDPTFRSYSSAQAEEYASHRLSYSPQLYDLVLQHHASTGGSFGSYLDVGCGPGNATRDLARSFDRAMGVDAGPAMIETARKLGGTTKSGGEIRFEVSPAESFAAVEGLGVGSVDFLSCAMAAHWFEMDKFWVEAAKVLKPGGTVALWTSASWFPHPNTPNYPAAKAAFLRLEREYLDPYELPANRLSRDMYDDLLLPWQIPSPSDSNPAAASAAAAFPEQLFVKHEFDREGVLSNGKSFFANSEEDEKEGTLVEDITKGLGTASMVTRWREANSGLVGTQDDVVEVFGRELRDAVGSGVKSVVTGSGTAILLFKRI